MWSRNGLITVIPWSSVTILGRTVHTYMMPVAKISAQATSSPNRSWPWMARSMKLITTKATQIHHSTSGGISRNTVRPSGLGLPGRLGRLAPGNCPAGPGA